MRAVFQSVQRDLLESSMGVVLLRERLDHRRNAGDLQASEIAKTIILVVNGKADVTVLFQSDELSPAFREHPELAVMLHLTGIWITFPVTEFVVCIIAVVFVRKDRSCHES